MNKRDFLGVVAAACAALVCANQAAAQAFPNKPVTLMVPYPAGGLSDVIARKVNVALAKNLAQPVIVENLGGASGSIAANKVLAAPTDGYLIFQGSPNELIFPPLAMSAVKYKAEDFRMVQMIAIAPMAILARKDIPASNPDELIAYATKAAKEGKPLTYASVGVGSFYHLLGEELSRKVGVQMTHVPYKGISDAVRDLMAGAVDVFLSPYGAPQIALEKETKIKILGVLASERDPNLKHIPSVDESRAMKGFTRNIWTGYFVPAKTPEPIVQALHKAVTATLSDAEVKTGLVALGQSVAKPYTLDEAAKVYATNISAARAVAKTINLQAQ